MTCWGIMGRKVAATDWSNNVSNPFLRLTPGFRLYSSIGAANDACNHSSARLDPWTER